MGRIYGRQNIPKKAFAGPKEEKYWGWIQTIEANEDFTLKRVFMREEKASRNHEHLESVEVFRIVILLVDHFHPYARDRVTVSSLQSLVFVR